MATTIQPPKGLWPTDFDSRCTRYFCMAAKPPRKSLNRAVLTSEHAPNQTEEHQGQNTLSSKFMDVECSN
jgi:hypothetical protein